jgi:hypothetical protein
MPLMVAWYIPARTCGSAMERLLRLQRHADCAILPDAEPIDTSIRCAQ